MSADQGPFDHCPKHVSATCPEQPSAQHLTATFQVAATWSSRGTVMPGRRTHKPDATEPLSSAFHLPCFSLPRRLTLTALVSQHHFTPSYLRLCSRCFAANLLCISTLAQDSHGRSTSRYPHQTSIRSTRKQPAIRQKQAKTDVTSPGLSPAPDLIESKGGAIDWLSRAAELERWDVGFNTSFSLLHSHRLEEFGAASSILLLSNLKNTQPISQHSSKLSLSFHFLFTQY